MLLRTKLMMLGPPGAGKGTQAQRLSEAFDLPQISTGDMLRAAKKAGTSLGKEAARYMDAGNLVPDAVVVGVVSERLSSSDVKGGFILDGFPRTLAQAEALTASGITLDAVISIDVADSELVERITGRLSCPDCGAAFHKRYSPPSKDGECDKCGGALRVRKDDTEEVFIQRLSAYKANTAPLIDYYGDLGLLHTVNGVGDLDDIQKRVFAIVEG